MIDRETVAVASIADGRTWRKTAKKAIKNKVARRVLLLAAALYLVPRFMFFISAAACSTSSETKISISNW